MSARHALATIGIRRGILGHHLQTARNNTGHQQLPALDIRRGLSWHAWGRSRRSHPHHPPPLTQPPTRRRRLVLFSLLALSGGLAGGLILNNAEELDHQYLALVRSCRTAKAAILIGIDYKLSLRRGPDDIGQERYDETKNACHKRSAERLLELCKANQGIYIKLGQHIAAMVFLLPPEYTETMKPLQDRCPPTPLKDIEQLFQTDLNCKISDVFLEFDPVPLGVASLAQVHRAKLLTGEEVAVKVQHPYLDEYAPVDIASTVTVVRLAKRIFPEFEFAWLAEEMQQSLPQELDFVHEAQNADKIRDFFADSSILRIPRVYWSNRRLLIMEFANGGKIDDLNYMKSHGINPQEVSAELSTVYSEMIFLHGFVHCDPHPGNVFVRPYARSWISRIPILSWFTANPRNFEIVLLDHGLYRQLTSEFRLDYAHLWSSILAGDEAGILLHSYRLFTHVPEDAVKTTSDSDIDYHRLFASMLTGRSWDVISTDKGGIAQARTAHEYEVIKKKAETGKFFLAIADILSKLPRELLLLLKTNDLLRAVDEALGVSGAGATDHMLRTVSTMGWYCQLAIKRETIRKMVEEHIQNGQIRPVWSERRYWESTWQFWKVGVKIWALDCLLWARRTFGIGASPKRVVAATAETVTL
ncbi:ABC1 family-domain-containing protein [Phlyctochytrium arcticum]|nr:ABC1 family-domain-containing protein [Phlyctochytrium arcticum]